MSIQQDDTMLILLLVLLLVFFCYYRLSKREYTPRRQYPITKMRLFRITVWPYIAKYLLISVPIVFILAAAGHFRRIRVGAAAGSAVFICLLLFLFYTPQIFSQARSLRPLIKIRNFDHLLSAKQLQWENGTWKYEDEIWFIRANHAGGAVLYADMIDFSIPVRNVFMNWYVPNKNFSGSTSVIWYLRFTCKDGSFIDAGIHADESLRHWLKQHRGKFAK